MIFSCHFYSFRFLPTKKNTCSWRLEKEIRKSLRKLIRCRKEKEKSSKVKADTGPKDLLGVMIDAGTGKSPQKKPKSLSLPSAITVQDIIEECKTFFFAGKQTTSNLLTWTTVLLALHPEWQEMAREEIIHVCGFHNMPTKGDIVKLKKV